MRALSVEDFAFVVRLLHRRSGLVLTPDKIGLFDRRLPPVLGRFGLKTSAQLVRELRLGNDSLAAALAEAMTVNDTWFFRDPDQFAALRSLLPRMLARRGGKRLRVWSAGCASGQEAYSLAILLDELGLTARGWMVDLIATDLSAEAIARAERGHYTGFEIQRGLSEGQREKYFTAENGGFSVCRRLRRLVRFRRFNLLDSFGWLDDLDLVLCRNVLIYFDRATKLDILERAADCMAENGLLLLGETESPQIFTPVFQPGDNPVVFVKARPGQGRRIAG